MHKHSMEKWRHEHDFAAIHEHGEQRTLQVLVLTAITMVVEIGAGVVFGSMALLADGWHMGTHAAAFLITIFAYSYARKHAADPNFTFGVGKVSVLGGFASAVALAVVALMMAVESVERLMNPREIHFNQAIAVAALGLVVNVLCAFLLREGRDHSHGHGHSHHHHHHHHRDHNLTAAYLHVLADALTSVMAIIALTAGKMFGWGRLDPVMGLVGAVIITRWAYGLLKDTSPILLDRAMEKDEKTTIREKIELDSDNLVSDLHYWRVGPAHYAVILSVVTHYPKPVEYYKKLLAEFENISHITVEVNEGGGEPCIDPPKENPG